MRQAAVVEQLQAEVVAPRAENAELNVGWDEFDELAEAAVVGLAVRESGAEVVAG